MEMKKTEQVTRILSLAGSICRAHPRRRLVGETQTIVAAPQQGDLASVGFEKAGIANQTGSRDVGIGDRQGSVRKKRSLWSNKFVAWNVMYSMLRIC